MELGTQFYLQRTCYSFTIYTKKHSLSEFDFHSETLPISSSQLYKPIELCDKRHVAAHEAESSSKRITPLTRHKTVTSHDTVTSYYPIFCQRHIPSFISSVIGITLLLEHTLARRR